MITTSRSKVEAAHLAERLIIDQAGEVVNAWIELGRLLHEFDEEGFWAFRPDPNLSDGTCFTSFDKWLRNTPALAYSTARVALQAYRLYIIELDLDREELIKVDHSKFVNINPVVQEVIDRRNVEANTYPEQAAEIIRSANAEAVEWVLFAQDASKSEIIERRNDGVGYRSRVYELSREELWADAQHDFNPGMVTVTVRQGPHQIREEIDGNEQRNIQQQSGQVAVVSNRLEPRRLAARRLVLVRGRNRRIAGQQHADEASETPASEGADSPQIHTGGAGRSPRGSYLSSASPGI